jgi:hypothetical protein
MKYYHVAPVDAAESIEKNGLKPGHDGHIYVVDELTITHQQLCIDVYITDIVAQRQLGRPEYLLIEIDGAGITSKVKDDNVAEVTAGNQKRIKQSVIKPQYLTLKHRVTASDAVNHFMVTAMIMQINGIHPLDNLDKKTLKMIKDSVHEMKQKM